MTAFWGVLAALSVLALTATARDGGIGEESPYKRSAAVVREFKRAHPCPATGQTRGACPGWVVDHRMPLCSGAEDEPGNMQWQTVEDAKAKDRDERRLCRSLKR